jgi:hypothetical protein
MLGANMKHWISAVCLALLAACELRADEETAVRALRKLGAHIERDDTQSGKPVVGIRHCSDRCRLG